MYEKKKKKKKDELYKKDIERFWLICLIKRIPQLINYILIFLFYNIILFFLFSRYINSITINKHENELFKFKNGTKWIKIMW